MAIFPCTLVNPPAFMNKPIDAIPPAPATLPGHYYVDPAIFEQEKEAIFYRTWQYIGHLSMFEKGASYVVRDIADESIVVLRERGGDYRAFYNVCQHRAHQLLEGEGALPPLIVCPYHTWAYDHSGQLRKARGTDHIEGFDTSKIQLKSVRLEQWCGFLFVNLDDDATPISELLSELEPELRSFSATPENLKIAERYAIPLAANWKNSIENFSECYHCPNKHPTLSENALDLTSYKIECQPHYHVHRSQDLGEHVGYKVDPGAAGRPNEFRSFFIWPNIVFEVYPGGNLTVFHHAPDGVGNCIQGIEWYFGSSELTEDERAVVDFVHTVRLEDVPLCESVQRGLGSRGYGQGTLVVDPNRSFESEHAVYDFQQKVLKALEYTPTR